VLSITDVKCQASNFTFRNGSRPTGILKGHDAPVSYLCIFSEDGHIYSVSTDKTAKVRNWFIT